MASPGMSSKPLFRESLHAASCKSADVGVVEFVCSRRIPTPSGSEPVRSVLNTIPRHKRAANSAARTTTLRWVRLLVLPSALRARDRMPTAIVKVALTAGTAHRNAGAGHLPGGGACVQRQAARPPCRRLGGAVREGCVPEAALQQSAHTKCKVGRWGCLARSLGRSVDQLGRQRAEREESDHVTPSHSRIQNPVRVSRF
jgi:hypothetical protein